MRQQVLASNTLDIGVCTYYDSRRRLRHARKGNQALTVAMRTGEWAHRWSGADPRLDSGS